MQRRFVSQEVGETPTIIFLGESSWLVNEISTVLEKRGYEAYILPPEHVIPKNIEWYAQDISKRFISRVVWVFEGEGDSRLSRVFFSILQRAGILKLSVPIDIVVTETFRNFLDKRDRIAMLKKVLEVFGGDSKIYVFDPAPGVDQEDIEVQGDLLSQEVLNRMFSGESGTVHIQVKKRPKESVQEKVRRPHPGASQPSKENIREESRVEAVRNDITTFDAWEDTRLKKREELIMKLFAETPSPQPVFRKTPTQETEAENVLQEPQSSGRKIGNLRRYLGVVVSILAGLAVVVFVLILFIGYHIFSLRGAYGEIKKAWGSKNVEKVQQTLPKFSSSNRILRSGYEKGRPLFSLIVGEKRDQEIETMFQVNASAVDAASALFDMSTSLSNAYTKVMASTDGGLAILEESNWKIENAYRKLSVFLGESQKGENVGLFSYGDQVKAFRQDIQMVQKQLVGVQQLSQVLPELLGIERKKTYLVLIQNSAELRPTGGFLQTIAFFTFERGQLLDFQVQDVLTTDAQLKGQVTPPADLQKSLGETRWYLRDSNWDGDFSQAAKQAAWFVEKELGRTVDGIVGMNTAAFPALLSATGVIDVPEYNETVTSANVLERISTHNDLGIVEAENGGKKDFLTVLTKHLFQSIVNAQSATIEPLGAAVFNGLRNGEITVYMYAAELQRVFVSVGWGGTILTPPCPQQLVLASCYVDRMYAVEANVGVNKVNPYIRRKASHNIVLDANTAVHTYTVTYENTAASVTWPLGIYKNYLRLYLPRNSQVNSVVIDEEPVPPSRLTFSADGENSIVGVYLEVPIRSTATVKASYTVTMGSNAGDFTYAYFVQKQPGVSEVPTTVSIQLQPPNMLGKIAPMGTVKGNSVLFTDPLHSSYFVGVQTKGL